MSNVVRMARELSLEEKTRFYEAFLANLHRHAVTLRAQGRFDGANYFAEQVHQWECMFYIAHGEFPGLESAWMDELVSLYGKTEKPHASIAK